MTSWSDKGGGPSRQTWLVGLSNCLHGLEKTLFPVFRVGSGGGGGGERGREGRGEGRASEPPTRDLIS